MGLRAKTTDVLRFFLLRRLPTCKQMVALMSESMERRLTWRERVVLRVHLWVCAWCAWYLEHLHLMRDSLRQRAGEAADDESTSSASLSTEARERMKFALRDRR